ncbi:MAG: hypothetical protein LC775_15505, partial [Acidobacteria bacterium]|nr:hypothetical protein [Acidobacteriota bacterium]
MRSTKYNTTTIALFVVGALALCLLLLSTPAAFTTFASMSQTTATSPPKLTAQEKRIVANFNRHVKDYLKQRQAVAKKLPKLSKESTPQQIESHQQSFVAALRA